MKRNPVLILVTATIIVLTIGLWSQMRTIEQLQDDNAALIRQVDRLQDELIECEEDHDQP